DHLVDHEEARVLAAGVALGPVAQRAAGGVQPGADEQAPGEVVLGPCEAPRERDAAQGPGGARREGRESEETEGDEAELEASETAHDPLPSIRMRRVFRT